MRISSRLLSSVLSCMLVVGLCPGFAYATELVPAGLAQESTFDASDSILQAGGLISAKPTVTGPRLKALSTSNISGFEAALAKAAENWNGTDVTVAIDASSFGLTGEDVKSSYPVFCNRNAQYFYLTGRYSYSHNQSGTVTSVTLLFDNSFSKADITAFSAAANAALSGVESGWSDEQKSLYLHDWLVTHCEYDLNAAHCYSAYGALVDGRSVCQGYALAYDYLLGQAGVDCDVITSSGINHAWNLVTIGGKTYYADCTWDDPSNVPLEAYCAHGNFLCSKSKFGHVGDNAEEPVTDWVDTSGASVYGNSSVASSTSYDNAYWGAVCSAIPHVGDLWAYPVDEGDNKAKVCAHDYATGGEKVLASGLDGIWRVVGNPQSYWLGNYTNLVSNGASFLATTPTSLVRVEVDGATSAVYELTADEKAVGYIYGLTRDAASGICRYQLCAKPLGEVTGSGEYEFPARTVAVTGVTVSPATQSVWRGSAFSLTATVAPADATNKAVAWTSADKSIATVSSSGMVQGVAAGTTTITAKTADGGYAATCTVTVKTVSLTNSSITVTSVASRAYNGKAYNPKPTVKYGSATLKLGTDYTISYLNASKKAVSAASVKATGTYYVKIAGKGKYSGAMSVAFKVTQATNPMNVAAKLPSVSYNKKKAQAVAASKAYTFKKKAAGTVTYARVASGSSKWLPAVNKKTGAITVKAGAPKGKTQSVKVKVTAAGNANYKPLSKTVTVKVKVK